MIWRRSALACWYVAAMLYRNDASAGVWGMDPTLGVVADYASNPALLLLSSTAQTNGALLIDAPTTYNGDAFEFYVVPSFRLGDSHGYSSVASDYAHLNVKSEFDSERGMFTAAAGLARDSSLYQDYLTSGATGVRRDTFTADLNWDRHLTERIDFDADAGTQEVRYGPSVGTPTLVDFKYTTVSPTFTLNSSEQNKLTLAASVGRYQSLDGTTESRSANLQVGFMRQFSEIWSLTATAGYSRSLNRLSTAQEEIVPTPNGLSVELIPLTVESSQNGTVYLVNVTRQGSRWTLNASASRQLTPTGLAYLSRQELYEIKAAYSLTARWSLTPDVRFVKTESPAQPSGVTDYTVKYFGLSTNWRWTEQVTLSVNASRVAEKIQPPTYNVSSNELTITLSRQFNHIKFQ
ncbi:MAG TPA: hypothetical protein VGI32_03095 [Steroidobacteraceae bacterium]